jgi:hypothetical protein
VYAIEQKAQQAGRTVGLSIFQPATQGCPMNANLPTAPAMAPRSRFSALYSQVRHRMRGPLYAAFLPTPDTVRAALAYLALWLLALLMAAACIVQDQAYFVF